MARAELLDAALLAAWPLPRAVPGDDKHDRGTVLVVGGAASTPGALLLAGLAALRVGAGRLQLATARESAPALAVAVPESMCTGYDDLAAVDLHGADVVLVGPGLLDVDETRSLVTGLLPRLEGRGLVVDAVGLLALPDGPLPGPAVLTPNPSELEAMAPSDGPLPELAAEVAAARGAAVTTQDVVAAADGRIWSSHVGDVGLATSGSGDVLAGLAAGMLARGADPAQAACWAHWLHGTAGGLLAAEVGRTQYLGRELLDAVPRALRVVG